MAAGAASWAVSTVAENWQWSPLGSPSPGPRPGQTSPNGPGAWTNRKAQACLGRTLSAGQDRPARSSPCHDSWDSTGTGSRRRACTPHSCQSFGGTNSAAQTGRRSSCSHRKPRVTRGGVGRVEAAQAGIWTALVEGGHLQAARHCHRPGAPGRSSAPTAGGTRGMANAEQLCNPS